mgnify:CR=1 FL=1
MRQMILTLLIYLLAMPAAFAKDKESTYDRVIRTGEIRCGYLPWPPLLSKDMNTGEVEGPVADYINRIGEVLDLKIIWSTELNLTTYLQDLNNKRFDMECGGGWPNAIRGKYVDYTAPIFYMPFQIIKRKGDSRFTDLVALNDPDFTMAIMDGENSAATKQLKFPKSNVVEIPSSGQVSDLILAVATKKADFTVVNTPSALAYMQNNQDKIELVEPPVKYIPINISIAQDEPKLKTMLNVATEQLVLSGEIDQILKNHDPEHASYVRVAKPYIEELNK